MFAKIHYKCQRQIDDHRRANGKERSVDKEESDACSWYLELFTQTCTDTKSFVFKKTLNSFHFSNKIGNNFDLKNVQTKFYAGLLGFIIFLSFVAIIIY